MYVVATTDVGEWALVGENDTFVESLEEARDLLALAEAGGWIEARAIQGGALTSNAATVRTASIRALEVRE